MTTTDVHIWIGVAVVVSNLAAGSWGAVSWLARRPSVGFWYLLRVAQVLVVAQVVVGTVLLSAGREPPDSLHLVYGLLPLLVSFLAEGVRANVPERELEGIDFDGLPEPRRQAIALAISRNETGIMAASALVIFGLTLRAALTGSVAL